MLKLNLFKSEKKLQMTKMSLSLNLQSENGYRIPNSVAWSHINRLFSEKNWRFLEWRKLGTRELDSSFTMYPLILSVTVLRTGCLATRVSQSLNKRLNKQDDLWKGKLLTIIIFDFHIFAIIVIYET